MEPLHEKACDLVPIEIKMTGVEELVKKLDKTGKLFKVVTSKITRFGAIEMQREVKAQASGKSVNVRSGRFRRSITAKFTDGGQIGNVGSNVIYAPLLEFGSQGLPGGVITPKTKSFLTVPLPAAMTAAGVKRGSARDFADTFVRTNPRTGKTVLYQRQGQDSVVPLFVLVESVRIRPHRPFANAQKIVEPKVLKFAQRLVAEVLRGA